MKKTEEQERKFRNIINFILRCNPRTSNGDSLLHLVVSKSNVLRTNSGEETRVRLFPDVSCIELLLESGAIVDDVNGHGFTPLHLACNRVNFHQKAVETLLKMGAHIDRKSANGDRAHLLLSSITESTIDTMKFISLKCLAARKVSEHGIPFEAGSIPYSLEEFIRIH